MTSTGRTRAGRQIMERPRSSAAPAAKAGGNVVGSTPSRWLETMPPVRANQKRDRPVRTRPLSGIAVGSTTSNAESQSLATSSRRPASTRYRSRTFPERTKPSAIGTGALLLVDGHELVEPGDDGGHVAQQVCVVEAGGERVHGDRRRQLRVEGQDIGQRSPLVRNTQGVALDDRVGLLAGQSALLDEGEQYPARGMQAEPALDVLGHPVGTHDELVDEPGELHRSEEHTSELQSTLHLV